MDKKIVLDGEIIFLLSNERLTGAGKETLWLINLPLVIVAISSIV